MAQKGARGKAGTAKGDNAVISTSERMPIVLCRTALEQHK